MAGMQALRKQAKAAGVPAREIRSAESAAELRKLISAANGTSTKASRKRVVKKAVVKKSKRGPGRPKGSKNKPKATATAKRGRPAKAKRGRPAKAASNGNGGRFLLSGVNFSRVNGWNPREGSVPDVIVKALRKAKGNRESAFKALRPKLKSLVPVSTRDGRKRSKDERENYLRYLISRNAWAFALATGQHESSENRAKYGTAGTGEGIYKPRRGRKPASKTTGATRKAKRGPGRPKGSKSRPKATATARRGRPPAKRGPGRPKGSKNKPKR